MNWPRLTGVVLAVGLHGGLLYAFTTPSGPDSFASDGGQDRFSVVATVSLEKGDLFTQQAAQAAADASTQQADSPPKPEKQQEVRKPEGVDAKDDPLPLEEIARKPPAKEQHDKAQTASLASVGQEAQRAAAELAERRNKIWSDYVIEVHATLERRKLRPSSGHVGDVLIQVTIAPDGQLVSQSVMKSSGFTELDKAAIASLERASPFPPIPSEIAAGPLTLTVPFQYRTR